MGIDSSIALNVRPLQLANPLEQFGQFQQARAAMSQNRLADMMFGEKQREVTDTNALNQAYKRAVGADGALNRNQLFGDVAAAGLGSRIPGLQKTFVDLDKDQALADKSKADAKKTDLEAASHQFEMAGQLASAWAKNPGVTQKQIRSGLAAAAHSKIISPDIYQAKLAELDGLPDDAKSLNQWALGTLQQVMKAKDSMGFIAPDANTVANNATSRANNAATVAASRDNAAATRDVAAATRDAARIQRDQSTEMKLADDYRAQSKGFKEVGDAYQQISSTLEKATTSPAATLAAATKFMKLLDPGSVVRESELGMALAATGAIDRMTNYVNTMKYGKVLTAQQVADFRNITKQIYGAAQTQQQKIDASYRNQAETYKLRPEVIIQDMGQTAPGRDAGAGTQPAAAARPPQNARGWTLMVDARGNQAYVSPDGKQHEEVR
jgi:hypothetical protein